jgi:hypothetical protein
MASKEKRAKKDRRLKVSHEVSTSLAHRAAVASFLSVAVFSVIAYLRGRPLVDFLELIGSTFVVSFIALVGLLMRFGKR